MQAIARVARRVPRATCLTQSLAAYVLLKRSAIPATLKFGVRRNPANAFEAHAWIECDGKNISPQDGVPAFDPLPPL